MVTTSLSWLTPLSPTPHWKRNPKALHATLSGKESQEMNGDLHMSTHMMTQQISWQSLCLQGRKERVLSRKFCIGFFNLNKMHETQCTKMCWSTGVIDGIKWQPLSVSSHLWWVQFQVNVEWSGFNTQCAIWRTMLKTLNHQYWVHKHEAIT